MKNRFTFLFLFLIVTHIHAQQFNSFKTEQELKTYLVSKLVWNPDPGFDIKKKDFIKNYFEEGSPFIKNIIDTIAYTVKKKRKQFILYKQPYPHRDDYLSPELIGYYHQQIGLAIIETLRNPKAIRRVDKFAQTFRYADIEIAKTMVNTDYWVFVRKVRKDSLGDSLGEKSNDNRLVLKPYYDSLLNEFVDKSRIFGLPVLYSGLKSIEDYERKTRDYFKTEVEKHLAVKPRSVLFTPGILLHHLLS